MRSLYRLQPALIGLLILGLWEISVRLSGVATFILPPPSLVAARFAQAWGDGTMMRHLLPTVMEVTVGGPIGGALGLMIGIGLGLSGVARRLASPYLVAAQSTPILALGPLLVLWFGPGTTAKIVICALITLFPMVIATLVAVRDADRGLLELGRSIGASRIQSLLLIRLPSARSGIFAGARVAATLAVVGAIVGEWLGGSAGLGILVNLARGSLFDTPLLFAALLQIALLGAFAYTLVVFAERLSTRLLR
ncbi:MAG: ABC transporter permease [Candidatus Limnocylindrus sp.]